MSVVGERIVVEYATYVLICQECGSEFEIQRELGARGQMRTRCDSCAGPKRPGWQPYVAAVRSELPGRAFTVPHFSAWCARLRLKGDEAFKLERWEREFVRDVFAGYRQCWLVVPEGNGKSTLIALLVLYCLEFSEEAAIPVAASARDQAEIIFTQARAFGRRTPGMEAFRFKAGLREITWGESCKAKVYASDADTGDGVIPWPIMVLDELHRHSNLELYRTWAGKLEKEQAQLIAISTAGAPGSEFEEVRELMRQTADKRTIKGAFGRYADGERGYVLHEYAVPEAGDVEDMKLVKAANPSARITVRSLRAKRRQPSFSLSHWRRMTCNMPTRVDSAAISEHEWEDARSDARIPIGEPIWVGYDQGIVLDTTALVPFWWRGRERRLLGDAVVLEPPGGGATLDPNLIEHAFLEMHALNPIALVVMDPTRAEQLAEWLKQVIGCDVVARTQSNPMAASDYVRFMEALGHGWLRHTGDPVLTRHVLNAIARLLPNGQVRFDRPRQSRTVSEQMQRRRVIDALQAAAMVNSVAAATLLEEPEPEEEILVAVA